MERSLKQEQKKVQIRRQEKKKENIEENSA
jgi:hypothetical protein